jgi:DNA-binding NarL/FixJ family response regulator
MVILVADRQPKVRFALRVLLERQPGLESIWEAVDAESLLAQLRVRCPDVVLLSWELPGLLPTRQLSELRDLCPGLSIIVLSGRPRAQKAALEAGADAFVSKTDPPERLLGAISGCCGGTCLAKRVARTPGINPGFSLLAG